jgi:hypothetical protein
LNAKGLADGTPKLKYQIIPFIKLVYLKNNKKKEFHRRAPIGQPKFIEICVAHCKNMHP